MEQLAHRSVAFFVDNFPSGRQLAAGVPLGILWALACLALAGWLKRRGLKTGYTRKIFHFLTFFSVVVLHQLWGTPVVCLFGGMTSLVILYAVLRGPGHLLYEAMAREQDAPRRTHFIVVPYAATLVGGLATNILFGPFAVVGYLTTGLGDAVGEPVGTRFGRHRYRVPSVRGVPAVRSLEGSAAVLVFSVGAVLVGVWVAPELQLGPRWWLTVPGLGLVCAAVEALSPHGWDNATLQIIPSYLATILF